jgi:hypothetical protein
VSADEQMNHKNSASFFSESQIAECQNFSHHFTEFDHNSKTSIVQMGTSLHVIRSNFIISKQQIVEQSNFQISN